MARMKYGLVDTSAMAHGLLRNRPRQDTWAHGRASARAGCLSAHGLFGGGHGIDERLAREQALGVLQERRRGLVQLDLVVVEPPQERRDRHVEHRELLAQHVLL